MPETMPKQRYYFRKTDPTDQALYRLLARQRPEARTALFRKIVLRGYRQYLKQQQALRRRAKKERSNGSPPELLQPVKTTRPVEDCQPWK
jgi:hypothetical protein